MAYTENQETAQPSVVALFVSDIHLAPELPATTSAFLHFLQQYTAGVPQLYILGDLFEYWIGDDDMADEYHQKIIRALKSVSDAGTQLFWVAGNRDFLIGRKFIQATGMLALQDPTTITITDKSVTICHGDTLCTDDTDYIEFRSKVRNPIWQQEFLSLPLSKRKSIARDMRTNSRKVQSKKSIAIMDVNIQAVTALQEQTGSSVLIHGHTHRPAVHISDSKYRYVLPDWDCDAVASRGGWLALYSDGKFSQIDVNGNTRTDLPNSGARQSS